YLWAWEGPEWLPHSLPLRLAGSLLGLVIAAAGYTYPLVRYLLRQSDMGEGEHAWGPTLRRMLLAACLSGVALLGTWGSTQWAPKWANSLAKEINEQNQRTESPPPPIKPQAMSSYTQFWGALGAIVGTILAALMADWLGR